MPQSFFVFECQVVGGRGLVRAADGDKVVARVACGPEERTTAAAAVRGSETKFPDGTFEFVVEDPDRETATFELLSAGGSSVMGKVEVSVSDYLDYDDIPAGSRQFDLSNSAGKLELRLRLVKRTVSKEEFKFGVPHYMFMGVNALIVAVCVTALIQSAVSDASWSVELSIGARRPLPAARAARRPPDPPPAGTFLPRAMIGIAIISLVAAAAAIYAVNRRESFLIHTYAYLTVCVVLMQVILGAIAFGSMSGTSAQLDHGWDAWRNSPEDRARLQELQADFQCCGFNGMDDRAVDPCPKVVRARTGGTVPLPMAPRPHPTPSSGGGEGPPGLLPPA